MSRRWWSCCCGCWSGRWRSSSTKPSTRSSLWCLFLFFIFVFVFLFVFLTSFPYWADSAPSLALWLYSIYLFVPSSENLPTFPAYEWSIVRICLRFLHLIGLSGGRAGGAAGGVGAAADEHHPAGDDGRDAKGGLRVPPPARRRRPGGRPAGPGPAAPGCGAHLS